MSQRERTLICFTGIDGAGKTTLAKRLVNLLGEHGIKSRYVYGAYETFVLRLFLIIVRAIWLRRKNAFADYAGYYGSIKRLSRNRLLATGYQVLTLLEYFLQILLKVTVPLMLGKKIVCDRYVYDVMTDLAVNLGYSDGKFKKMLKRVLFLCPNPDLIFSVDVPEQIAYERKSDVPSRDYLSQRKKFYLIAAEQYRMISLDGTRDIRDLEALMKDLVTHILPRET